MQCVNMLFGLGLGLAAFIIHRSSVELEKVVLHEILLRLHLNTPYEPPFRQDGVVHAINGNDTLVTFRVKLKMPKALK